MAAETVIPTEDLDDIPEDILGLIDNVLGDTVGDSIEQSQVGGSTLIQGTGANGETQGVLVPTSTPTTGTISNGDFVVDVDLPENVGLTFEGLNDVVTGEEAAGFLESKIGEALPEDDTSEAATQVRESLNKAVNTVINGGDTNTV